MELLRILFFCLFPALHSSADTRSLQYLITANTPGKQFTVALLDRKQFAYFENNITVMILMDCMKNVEADDLEYWTRETERVRNDQQWLQEKEQSFTRTKGVPVLNRKYGCDLNSNGTTRGYDQYTCDGEDFISLDLTTGNWTAANDKAKSFIKEWDSDGERAQHWKDFLEKDCIDQLKKFLSYSNVTLDRKEVVCHATGFFSKAVMMTWQKDGEDVHEDVELGETLANQDGSFQKRSILKIPTEDLRKHNYTCVVQHSSLEKKIVLEVPQGGESDAEPGGGLKAEQIAIIIVVMAIIGIVVCWIKRLCNNNQVLKNEKGHMRTYDITDDETTDQLTTKVRGNTCGSAAENDCIDRIKKFVSYDNDTAYRKDGSEEDMVELREMLPNQDGCFQKRSILNVPAEEVQKYTCMADLQRPTAQKY